MQLNKVIAIPVLALAGGLGLAACGTTSTPPKPAVTVTAPAPKPTTPAPTTAAPAPVVVVPAPAKTVYVAPPAPAAPVYSGANCGGGVYAGANTSCPFALNVAANYNGPGNDYAYSPVTGLNYTMYCTESYGQVTCTGGDNASVQFAG